MTVQHIQLSRHVTLELSDNFFHETQTESDLNGKKFFNFKISQLPHLSLWPVSQPSLQASFFLQNNLPYFSPLQNVSTLSHVYLDLPETLTYANLKVFELAYPAPILLKQSGVDLEKAINEDISLSKVYFFEMLDERRQILNFLSREKEYPLDSVVCVGGIQENLYTRGEIHWEENIYSEHWTRDEAIVPYFSLVLRNAEAYLENELLNVSEVKQAVLNFISHHSSIENKTLLIANPYFIVALGKILEENPYIIDKIKTSGNNLHVLKKNTGWEVLRVEPSAALDLSHVPPFFAECVIERKDVEKKSSKKNLNEKKLLRPFAAENPIFLKKDKKIDFLTFYHEMWDQLFSEACLHYKKWTTVAVSHSQMLAFYRYLQRLTIYRNKIFSLQSFDIALAAKSTINPNFSFEILKVLKGTNDSAAMHLPEVKLNLENFFDVNKMSVKTFDTVKSLGIKKGKANLKTSKKTLKNSSYFNEIDESKYKDATWANDNHPYFCSFPSEDIFLEEFCSSYRQAMKEKMKASCTTFQPLESSSLLDGIDIRETLREWHKDTIIVRNEQIGTGQDIGSVIINFANTEEEDKFTWKSFWLAEEHDDSNLMFYATPFNKNIIGPGIAKSEFGGFAVIPIPGYMEYPWENPYINALAQTSADVLLLVGALCSKNSTTLFISCQPPSAQVLRFLRQNGKKVIYTPIENVSLDSVRKIKTFHILAEAGVRKYAEKYILKS